MNIILWIVQGLLAIVFTLAGAVKLTQPKEKIAQQMPWAHSFTPTTIKLIGAVEALGVIGLIAPQLSGFLPWLTPLAAVGLALTMLSAMVIHGQRREYTSIAVNLVLLLLAAFVAYGRFIILPA